MDFSKSRCKGTLLHKFAVFAIGSDSIYERCLKCGKKLVIKTVNGNPNAVEYARNHMREFLIPQHRLFYKEYAKR